MKPLMGMRKTGVGLLMAAVMALGVGQAKAVVSDLVVNGGFESGDLSGWTTSGQAGAISVVASDTIGPPTSVTINPYEGDFFAKINLPGTPDHTAGLSQTISAATFDSATFSFAYRLASNDQTRGSTGNPNPDGNLIATLLINATPAYTQTFTINDIANGAAWTVGSWNVDGTPIGAGTNVTLALSFQANSLNTDHAQDGLLVYLDAIGFDAEQGNPVGPPPVPEPLTATLGSLALGGLALASLRRRSA